MRNHKSIAVFSIAAITLGICSTNFLSIPIQSSAFAKSTRAKDTKSKESKLENTNDKNNIASDKEITGDWRKQSAKAAELIFYKKHAEGDAILARILPIARKEDPHGIELGICLARYGYGLMGEKKYQKSISTLEEAFKIVQRTPQTRRQQKALFQILKAIATDYYNVNQFNKSEKFARQALAYRIAFPFTSSMQYFKNTYEILRASLQQQQKTDEAMIISEIVNTLS